MNEAFEIILMILGGIVLIGAIIFFSGLFTMFFWNLVMPFLFHLPQINIWIATGINVLLMLIKPTINITKK